LTLGVQGIKTLIEQMLCNRDGKPVRQFSPHLFGLNPYSTEIQHISGEMEDGTGSEDAARRVHT
jgi:hypothetical protein